MARTKTFQVISARLARQAKARANSIAHAKAQSSKHNTETSIPTKTSTGNISSTNIAAETAPTRPWAKVRAGDASLKFFKRSDPKQALYFQPWGQELVSTVLEAADKGGTFLCLVWPVQFDTVVHLHALASLERNFVRDLCGLRTLLYPGTHSTRTALQNVLIDRTQLRDLCRSLWNTNRDEGHISACTRSRSFEAALEALNDISINNPDVDNPSLGEVVPVFLFNTDTNDWCTTAASPVERSLRKVEKLARRRNIRAEVESQWGNPKEAPGALMVIHNSARKATWKRVFSTGVLQDQGKPEVILLDATTVSVRRSFRAVRRIPDFLRYISESYDPNLGSVIITDDPRTFFSLKTKLADLKLNFKNCIWAAEGDKAILSADPVPSTWRPEQRKEFRFRTSLVDIEASKVASSFQKLARDAGNDTPGYEALIEACIYIMRLSNIPAGYRDLTLQATEDGGTNFGSQRNSWTTVQLQIDAALQAGHLDKRRVEIAKTVTKAKGLIDAWSDSTPMGLRLLDEVVKNSEAGLKTCVVLPNDRYVQLTIRFFQRKFENWHVIKQGVYFTTHAFFKEDPGQEIEHSKLVLVGMDSNVLRELITSSDIPNNPLLLAAYKQADSSLQTLKGMLNITVFEPYQGRIRPLIQQLEQRLKEVPLTVFSEHIAEMKMTFQLEEKTDPSATGEQNYYKFELEGGGRAYSAGWIYRYDPDNDPPFCKTLARCVQVGDFVFEISDEIKSKLESLLNLKTDSLGSASYPQRVLLKLYHNDVQNRCEQFFISKKRSRLAREIYARMLELDPIAKNCKPSRIYYWLDLGDEGDTRPHAPKDAKFFRLFCKALKIEDESAATSHWNLIRNARAFNQNLGKLLSARYAEILFQPESVMTYRNLSDISIKQLQQEAMNCIYRVEKVLPPE